MNKLLQSLLAVLLINLAAGMAMAAKAPEVKIRVAQYASRIEVVMPAGGTWQADKKSGKIIPDRAYVITGQLQTKAVRRYHLMVGSGSAADENQLRATELKFKAFKTHRFLAGNTPAPGYPDNRVVFIGVGIFADEAEARKLQDKLAADGISSWVFIENIRPATGKLQLKLGKQTIIESLTGLKFSSKENTILRKAEFAKGYSWHGFEDRKFAGDMLIQFGVENSLDCIEITDLEKLLVGIVPSEISAKAPMAAMQAQAVAARGEMLSKKGVRHLNEGFDFCSEQHCQVYKGLQPTDQNIAASISPTRGLVLENHKGGILDAVYGANCGGHSSANQNIWTSNADPHLQGVSDIKTGIRIDLTNEEQACSFISAPPDCWCATPGVEGADKFRWKKSLSPKEWQTVEGKAAIGRIKEISGIVREISGRIVSIKLSGENGEKTVLKELPIRQLFGGLRSSFFKADWKRDKQGFINAADFEGAGWGHGVGMCQTGAQSMALVGQAFADILLHYFPGAKLVKLY